MLSIQEIARGGYYDSVTGEAWVVDRDGDLVKVERPLYQTQAAKEATVVAESTTNK